jgi:hypothetical protein
MQGQKVSATAFKDRIARRSARSPGPSDPRERLSARIVSLRAATGIADDEALAGLVAIGLTPETVRLLHLVPVVEVAWAEGGMTGRERKLIYDLAALRGVRHGSVAFDVLVGWLERPLPEGHFERSLGAIKASLDAMPARMSAASARTLIAQCAEVAAASREPSAGRDRIGSREHGTLERIAATLEG